MSLGYKTSINDINATSEISAGNENHKVYTNSESDKKELLSKMINTTNYFSTAKGEFTYYSANTETNMNIVFSVDIANSKSYEKNILNNLKTRSISDPAEESIYNGKNYIVARTDDFIKAVTQNTRSAENDFVQFSSTPVTVKPYLKKMSRSVESFDDRFEIVDGKKIYINKVETSLMGISKTVLLPEDFAVGVMSDNLENWEIGTNKNYLGRDCIEVTANLDSYYQEKHNANKAKLIVDVETGILLESKFVNNNGAVSFSTKILKLDFNAPIDQTLFNKYNEKIEGDL